MLAATIPWARLEVPLFCGFLERHLAVSVPGETTLRRDYLDECYTDVIREIKGAVQGQNVWIGLDETTDANGR